MAPAHQLEQALRMRTAHTADAPGPGHWWSIDFGQPDSAQRLHCEAAGLCSRPSRFGVRAITVPPGHVPVVPRASGRLSPPLAHQLMFSFRSVRQASGSGAESARAESNLKPCLQPSLIRMVKGPMREARTQFYRASARLGRPSSDGNTHGHTH
jgi:hypothetical protein